MVTELRNQLGVPDGMFMAQVISFSVDQLGLSDQIQGLSIMQQAQRCLAVLGSPLASDGHDGLKPPPSFSSPRGAGLPPISNRHVPKQVEAEAVIVGEVVKINPELDALRKQLALEKERNALLAERERMETEKAKRLEREAEAQRRLLAERERVETEKVWRLEREAEAQRRLLAERERVETEKVKRLEREAEAQRRLLAERERVENEKVWRLEREAEAQRRQKEEEEARIAMIERKKVATTDKALTVGGTIGFFCGGPVGMAIGMHVGDKWATKKIKERYPHSVAR